MVLGLTPHVLPRELAPQEKARLDALHRDRIELADTIFVVNVGGDIGESARAEIGYARKKGKEVLFGTWRHRK